MSNRAFTMIKPDAMEKDYAALAIGPNLWNI